MNNNNNRNNSFTIPTMVEIPLLEETKKVNRQHQVVDISSSTIVDSVKKVMMITKCSSDSSIPSMMNSTTTTTNATTTTTTTNSTSSSNSSNTLRKRRRMKKSLQDVYFYERSRAAKYSRKESVDVPDVALMTEQDSLSVTDEVSVSGGIVSINNYRSKDRNWHEVYIPNPLIDSSTIVYIGIFLFVLAMLWPPSILLITFVLSRFVPYAFRENDHAVTRRKLYQEFITSSSSSIITSSSITTDGGVCGEILDQKNNNSNHNNHNDYLPKSFYQLITNHTDSTVRYEESYWTNSRGMQLNTVIMTPRNDDNDTPINAVVCYCHGYTESVSYMKLVEFQRLCKAGIAFVAIEYEGHGRSDGTLALIEDWNCIIDDVATYFHHITQTNCLLRKKPTFLMGESMGGAISYDVYNRIPNVFTGVIFVCPMCKISDDMLPSPIVIDCLKRLLECCPWLGYLPITPSGKQSLENVSYKVASKRHIASQSPLNYDLNPRLCTARELMDATSRISDTLSNFDASFLVVHGKADMVTDPALSQQLYEESKSIDKSIKLYDDMWHALTSGEPDHNIDLVFQDIIDWIQQRI